ncbi:hypothetical protein EBR78_05760 [bacterium]|nr:hypothetical protein [bacterium]NBX81852.1 hypothetical protein [bacterium]
MLLELLKPRPEESPPEPPPSPCPPPPLPPPPEPPPPLALLASCRARSSCCFRAKFCSKSLTV